MEELVEVNDMNAAFLFNNLFVGVFLRLVPAVRASPAGIRAAKLDIKDASKQSSTTLTTATADYQGYSQGRNPTTEALIIFVIGGCTNTYIGC